MNKAKLFSLLCLFMLKAIGQNVKPPVDIKSPTAASLGKYGDVGVSYYTGTVNIGAPLYTIEEGGIPLNIGLQYDSGGIRVNQVPGWVGQNWSLNAGGVIVRTMRGFRRDEVLIEETHGSNNNTIQFRGYLYAKHRLNETNWTDVNSLKQLVEQSKTNFQDTNSYANMDLEPDIFNFNFMGMTGSFFLGQDGEWKVQSDNANLKITIQESDFIKPPSSLFPATNSSPDKHYKGIGKITITDNHLNQYIFGLNTDAIEYENSHFIKQEHGKISPNAWYLSQVKDRFGSIIYSLEYERSNPVVNLYRVNYLTQASCYDSGTGNFNPVIQNCVNDNSQDYYNGNLAFPVHLKNISTRAGNKILFSRSNSPKRAYNYLLTSTKSWFLKTPATFDRWGYLYTDENEARTSFNHLMNNYVQWQKLDFITIKDYHDKQIKKYQFNYNTADPNPRLNLKSIYSYNTSGNQFIKSYAFEYDDFNALPVYLSKKIDHWGYYNGHDYYVKPALETHYVNDRWWAPVVEGYFSEHAPTRVSREEFLKKGMLKKIIYPTKGHTEFKYEDHHANKLVNNAKVLGDFDVNTSIGGVRIKEITNFNGNTIENKRTFQYENGILFYKPTYENHAWRNDHETQLSFYFNINNLISLSNINGTHIGYSKVIEKFQDNSSVHYEYTNYNDFPDTAYEATLSLSHSVFDKSTDRSYQRGKLKLVSKFSATNSLVEKIEYKYRNDNQTLNNNFVKAFEYSHRTCSQSTAYGNAYKLFYLDYDVIEEKKTEYRGGNPITTTTTFEKQDYPSHVGPVRFNGVRRLLSSTSTMSQGETIKTKYEYLNDCTVGDCLSVPYGLKSKELVYNGNDLINQENTVFKDFNGKLLPEKSQSAKGSNQLKDDLIIYDYDSNANPTGFKTMDGVKTLVIWGYKSTRVIAEISNIEFSSISTETGLLTAAISQKSDLDKDTATENDLRNAFNTLRNQPDLQGAMIKTYTYDPLIGITSMTDERNRTVFYEYDDYNRLKHIKDHEGNLIETNKYNIKQ